jgi:hypothetical protein
MSPAVGRFAWGMLIAGTLVVSLSATEPPDDPARRIDDALAVQTAMKLGTDALRAGRPKQAVEILEAQVHRINGNARYLMLLRDAYCAYLRDCQDTEPAEVLARRRERLAILDPHAERTLGLKPLPTSSPVATPKSAHAPANASAPANSGGQAGPVARLTMPAPPTAAPATPAPPTAPPTQPDPFQQSPRETLAAAQTDAASSPSGSPAPATPPGSTDWLTQAEDAFAAEQFCQAALLYAQAFAQAPSAMSEAVLQRWAYCNLSCAVERLNQANTPPALVDESIAQVQRSLSHAVNNPRLAEECRRVLGLLQQRKASLSAPPASVAPTATPTASVAPATVAPASSIPATTPTATAPAVTIETANFRVIARDRAVAEQLASQLEQVRSVLLLRWAGPTATGDWSAKCEVRLHATAAAYAQATGQRSELPGHATIQWRGNAVVKRQLDLRADDLNLLNCTVPHETTHLVLADLFGENALPRWADEGMAILAEPKAQVARYTRKLQACRQTGELFNVAQLMQLQGWPDHARITPFFAQSVSLVEYLIELKGPREFVAYLNYAGRYGYEEALRRIYQIPSLAELQRRWERHAFGENLSGTLEPASAASGS